MRTTIITLLFLLNFFAGFCDDFTISLAGRKLANPLPRYYVEDVFLSQREDSCLGYVHPYGPHRINPVFFNRGIWAELKEFLVGSMPKQPDLDPVIIRINRIYMYELTKGVYEYTCIELSVSFICPGDSGLMEDFTSSATLEIFQKNIPASFGEVVAKAFDQCFSQYADRKAKGLTRPKIITTEQLKGNPINRQECFSCFSAKKPPKALYYSFADFRDNTPDTIPEFKILHDYNAGTPALSKAFLKFPKGSDIKEVWGFCEGDSIYFNNGRSYSLLSSEDDFFVTYGKSAEYSRDVTSAAIFGGIFGGIIGASLIGGAAAVSSDPNAIEKLRLDLFSGKLLPFDATDYTRINSRAVFFLSKVSDPAASLAVYINGEQLCDMKPGNFVSVDLSCHHPVAKVRLVSSTGGETSEDIPLELFHTDVFLLRVEKDHDVTISKMHDQMKKDMLKKRTKENTVCKAEL
ncbi:MAG: hypothetical protein ACOYNC_15260 [Bacteroidales bacterium]